MKKARSRLFLISIILAVASTSLIFVYLKSLDKAKVQTPMVTVLVANSRIEARTMIEQQMIKKIQVPDSQLVKAYVNNISLIEGKYAKTTIEKDEGFTISRLMDKEQNTDELTVKIDEGHRAVSINATGESGISKLVKPNDYVDIFVFLTEKTNGQKVIRPEMSKMILQNIKVLAIDRKLIREAKTIENENTVTNFLVTLSVPINDVGKLMLAEDIGRIKLALRPDNKEKSVNVRTITEKELVGNIVETAKTSTKSTSQSNKKASAKQSTYRYYKVKAGDTLMSISRKFYNNNENYIYLKKLNHIKDINNIIVGTTIRIPIQKH